MINEDKNKFRSIYSIVDFTCVPIRFKIKLENSKILGEVEGFGLVFANVDVHKSWKLTFRNFDSLKIYT